MIDRPTLRWSSTAWAFIATSVRPSREPRTMSEQNTSSAVGAIPINGNAMDSPADVTSVIVRLPKRSTSRPLKPLAARPPTPAPTSVMPRAASEMPRRSWISGSRGIHDAKVTPLTRNTTLIATREGAPFRRVSFTRPAGAAGV